MTILSLYLSGHAIRLILFLMGINDTIIAPVIISHGGNAYTILQIPAYIFYTIMGSLSCFGIIQLFYRKSFLDYVGRNSLVIYCVHFIFLSVYIVPLSAIIYPDSTIKAAMYTVIALFATVISCVPIIFISKYKPFCYLVGKI